MVCSRRKAPPQLPADLGEVLWRGGGLDGWLYLFSGVFFGTRLDDRDGEVFRLFLLSVDDFLSCCFFPVSLVFGIVSGRFGSGRGESEISGR